jgi:hypothetical protein
MRVPQVSERISERIKEAPAQALRGVFAGIGQLLLITDRLRNKVPFGQQVPRERVAGPSRTAAPHTAPAEPAQDRAPADRDVVTEQGAGPAATAPSTPRTPRAPRTPKIPAAPKTPKSPAAPAEIRDFDKTGNVRLIAGDEAPADDEPPGAAQPEPAPMAEAEPEPAPVAAAEPEPVAAAEEPVAAAEEPAPAAEETTPAGAEPAPTPADTAPPLPNYDELSLASLRARLRNLDVTQVRGLAEYEKAHAGRADVIVMFERRIAKLEAGD